MAIPVKMGQPVRPVRPKPQKFFDVLEGDALSNAKIDSLIAEGYTNYRFPDGLCPKVLPITGWKCEGIKLIFNEYMEQYMWIGLMAADWAPIQTHETPPEG